MSIAAETKSQVAEIGEKYKYGFITDIEMERAPKGLSEDTVRYISAKKGEPEWMLEWRLAAFKRWLAMKEPKWARVHYPQIDYQNAYYYAAPKNTPSEIVEKLNNEINTALADPKMTARLADVGGTVLRGSYVDFAKLVAEDIEKWAKVIRAANIKPE